LLAAEYKHQTSKTNKKILDHHAQHVGKAPLKRAGTIWRQLFGANAYLHDY